MRFLQIALLVCGLLAALLLQRSVAEEFVVGGRAGWRPRSVDYAQWSARNAYREGDSLVFPYDQGAQSVMRVSQEDFHMCRTSNPIEHYVDGNTIVRLDRDNYYFISGVPGHCNAGMKIEVNLAAGVLAGGSPSATPSSSPAAAPSGGVSSPAPTPIASSSPTPSHSPPVPTPSASPKTPPTTAPLPPPSASTPVPSLSPVTDVPPAPLDAPVSAPATLTPSQSPVSSIPPAVFSPAEGPGSAASALSSSLATLFIAALIVGLSTI